LNVNKNIAQRKKTKKSNYPNSNTELTPTKSLQNETTNSEKKQDHTKKIQTIPKFTQRHMKTTSLERPKQPIRFRFKKRVRRRRETPSLAAPEGAGFGGRLPLQLAVADASKSAGPERVLTCQLGRRLGLGQALAGVHFSFREGLHGTLGEPLSGLQFIVHGVGL
jgi:hypothetical protein